MDTWARPERKITTSPTGRRPRRCWSTKISEDDGAAHAFDAKHRNTDLHGHLDTATKKHAPGVQDRTGLHLYFLHPWDSGQEITGVQGIVAGGVQLRLFDRCRRRWRRLVQARSPGGIGGGGSTDKGGGVRLFLNQKKSRSALHFIEDAREQRAEVERVVRVHVGQGVERHLHQGHLHGLLDTDDGLR